MSFKGSPVFKHVTSRIKFIRKVNSPQILQDPPYIKSKPKVLTEYLQRIKAMLFKLGKKNADHCCSYTGDENLAKHKKAECVLRKN